MGSHNRWVLIFILMTSYSIQSLLITASKRQAGFQYDVRAAVFLAELFKLFFVSFSMTYKVLCGLSFRSSFAYLAPAVFYIAQNQLVFAALGYLSPPEYQLLNNGKLFTTSIVYRVVMKRPLRLVQWLALGLLGIGMGISTHNGMPATADPSSRLWWGTLLMVLVAWCSAIAGVINEKLIKGAPSVAEANIWLYFYGCVACAVHILASGPDVIWRCLCLEGFTFTSWLVVFCNAVLGQSIAYIMRYADSIVKIYAVCAAMIFTMLLSVLFFDSQLSLNMVSGYFACAISCCLFYCPPEVLMAQMRR